MRLVWLIPVLVATVWAPAVGQEAPDTMGTADEAGEDAVRRVLADAYVSGVHVTRDVEAVREGFHPDFVMLINDDGRLVTVSLQAWLERMQLDGVPTSDTIRHTVREIDVTGDAATATLEIYENGTHIYTDYFSLYRFPEGWRIVSKIFHGH